MGHASAERLKAYRISLQESSGGVKNASKNREGVVKLRCNRYICQILLL